MPAGDDLDTLLPKQVGPFERVELRRLDLDDSITYATYRAGESEVFVELGICGYADAAQSGIETGKLYGVAPLTRLIWRKLFHPANRLPCWGYTDGNGGRVSV